MAIESILSQELMGWIERIGVGGGAFYLVYVLLKRNQERTFQQADAILDLAKTTISDNTAALEQMHESLIRYMKIKDDLLCTVKDIKNEQNAKFKAVLDNMHRRS